MLDKVRETIRKYDMLKEGKAVLCGLSGGADSVTLLLCLCELGYEVSAVHVNHHLRGEEADRDEVFCRELCKRLGVPLSVEHIDVKGYCEVTGDSCEEGARKLRYEVFERSSIERIATAHTLSDSLETAVFNLARGSGAKGICGIPPVRGRFVRPLICCTREEIEQFLRSRGQDWVTDSTNLSDDYSRNRIRHGVIPVLKALNTDAEHAFERLAVSLRADDEYLFREAAKLLGDAESWNGCSIGKLKEAAEPVLSRAVILLLGRNGLPYDSARVNELCGMIRGGTGRVCLSRDIYALASGGEFRIAALTESTDECVTVTEGGKYELCGKQISIVISDKKQIDHKINKLFTYIALDYAKIKGVISVRTRRSGDSIRLQGRGCTKTLKKLFSESVPLEKRGSVLLLCDEDGAAAVEGFGAAERCAVDDTTETVLLFGIRND